jgi:hypothetical protein
VPSPSSLQFNWKHVLTVVLFKTVSDGCRKGDNLFARVLNLCVDVFLFILGFPNSIEDTYRTKRSKRTRPFSITESAMLGTEFRNRTVLSKNKKKKLFFFALIHSEGGY